MSFVIRLVCAANGQSTAHDGRFLKAYKPARMDARGEYLPGGLLETTTHLWAAKKFPSLAAAYECYRQSSGFRPDGQPNRPLTAWTIEVLPEEQAASKQKVDT